MLQTIILADDSMAVHSLVKFKLAPDCLNIHSVYDGKAAVDAAAALKPDLILLDIDMPQIDGFEACRQIKADPKTKSIPVIFLSADSMSADRTRGLGLGAADYVTKPFNGDDLRSRVLSSLRPDAGSNDSRLVDPLTGLGNKRRFEKNLRDRTASGAKTVSCIVVEIDQLGLITCKSGAPMANQLVRGVSNLLSQAFGGEDSVFCLPDRRFAVLSACSRFDAAARAKLLRKAAERSVAISGAMIQMTCSFGVCDTEVASAETLFQHATVVLERAINCGGNRVSTARAKSKPLAGD